MLDEDRVHPVLECAPVLDQGGAGSGPARAGAHLGAGQPDLGEEVAPRELGSTQQSIRSVLQASGASPRAFTASAIRTSQPASSSFVRRHHGTTTLRALQVASGSLTQSGHRNQYAVKERFAAAADDLGAFGLVIDVPGGRQANIEPDWVEVRPPANPPIFDALERAPRT